MDDLDSDLSELSSSQDNPCGSLVPAAVPAQTSLLSIATPQTPSIQSCPDLDISSNTF